MLDRKVGKQRPFWRGLLLTIVTLGIYGIYWNYKAHDEVFKQFELEKEGRDEGILFLVLGLIIGPLIWVYQYKFAENINHTRQELGLAEGVSSVEFLLWVTVGVLILVGPAIGYYKLQNSINEIWTAYEDRHETEDEATVEEMPTV
jgi:hypothetical protein